MAPSARDMIRAARLRILKQKQRGGGEALRIAHLHRAARGQQLFIGIGEVPPMRAGHDGGAELDRLNRVLPAMRHERAADQSATGTRL